MKTTPTLLALAVVFSARPLVAADIATSKLPAIDGAAVLDHTRLLASDEFEGRGPGSRGETLTVDYLTRQLRKLGLAPGHPDGT